MLSLFFGGEDVDVLVGAGRHAAMVVSPGSGMIRQWSVSVVILLQCIDLQSTFASIPTNYKVVW
jgi:hypothetical protein